MNVMKRQYSFTFYNVKYEGLQDVPECDNFRTRQIVLKCLCGIASSMTKKCIITKKCIWWNVDTCQSCDKDVLDYRSCHPLWIRSVFFLNTWTTYEPCRQNESANMYHFHAQKHVRRFLRQNKTVHAAAHGAKLKKCIEKMRLIKKETGRHT